MKGVRSSIRGVLSEFLGAKFHLKSGVSAESLEFKWFFTHTESSILIRQVNISTRNWRVKLMYPTQSQKHTQYVTATIFKSVWRYLIRSFQCCINIIINHFGTSVFLKQITERDHIIRHNEHLWSICKLLSENFREIHVKSTFQNVDLMFLVYLDTLNIHSYGVRIYSKLTDPLIRIQNSL